ncbi:DsbA family protein [Patescibacteria group bacterium]|nr:DsbA family protein [Patescibacteria group bacterium]MBU1029184.1 DsbA family protein [Patescibacteria group bacterium]MBU1916398.1 DsbA family protein [Patescibacteria group bacterium]
MANQGNSGITLSPKVSFILGLVGGVLVLCTVGFFILLGLILDGQANFGNGSTATDPNKVVQPSALNPTPTAAPEEDIIGEIKPIDENDHVLGPDDAEVTLIVYTDFECPFCGRFHPTLQQALKEYDGQIQTTIRHFPLSFHANARPAANAAECAGEQGKFFEYANALFENQSSLGSDLYQQLAEDLNLNTSKFSTCLQEQKYDSKISADMSSGITAGVQGTPGTIILSSNGEPQMVPGAVPYEQLKAMIDIAL